MIKRVHIQGYKSLMDVTVHPKPLAVLFGPNAAGKSNFLDALQLLSRMATSRSLKEAFEPPYRGKPLESFAFGPDGVKGLLSQDSAQFSIEVDVELSPAVVESVNRQVRELRRSPAGEEGSPVSNGKTPEVRERLLRYRVAIRVRPKSGILEVAEEYLAAIKGNGEPKRTRSPFLDRVGDHLNLRMEKQSRPTVFERFLDHAILSRPLYVPHYPHMVAMREELASWLFFYFEPRERMRAANPVKEVRHVGLMGEELAAYLNTLQAKDPAQFRAIEKALRMVIPAVDGIDIGISDVGEVELRLREGGRVIPSRVVSEGTLRILGLLALVVGSPAPAVLGFEEPENGIHPGRIRMIADLLQTRSQSGTTQFIATTHSPILPDLLPDEALLVCRRRGGHTEIVPFEGDGPLLRKGQIDHGLDEPLPVSRRMIRGDFDA